MPEWISSAMLRGNRGWPLEIVDNPFLDLNPESLPPVADAFIAAAGEP